MIVSENFHGFSVTIRSSFLIPDIVKTLKLFDTTNSYYCCLYGFDKSDHLGSYDENQKEFSCTVNGYNEMWAVMRVVSTMIESLES